MKFLLSIVFFIFSISFSSNSFAYCSCECVIACGQDALQPTTLKKEGKGLVTLAEFLKGSKVTAGTQL